MEFIVRKFESFNIRFDEYGADQWRADTLEDAKALLQDKINEMTIRKDISEENRQYWLEKFAKPIFVHRIVLEDVVE
jgi:hypothetical protein